MYTKYNEQISPERDGLIVTHLDDTRDLTIFNAIPKLPSQKVGGQIELISLAFNSNGQQKA